MTKTLADDIEWHDLKNHLPAFFVYQLIFYTSLRAMMYPMSVIKTSVQTDPSAVSQGTIATAKALHRRSGYKAFYRGFFVMSTGVIPAQCVYFTVYEVCRGQVTHLLKKMRVSDPLTIEGIRSFVSGGAASLASQLFVIPADIVASRLVLQGSLQGQTNYHNGRHALKEILRQDGIRGLYRGLLPSLLTHLPFSATWWAVYAQMRHLTFKSSSTSASTRSNTITLSDVFKQCLCGSTAAVVSVVLTNPADLCKTLIQTRIRTAQSTTQSTSSHTSSQSTPYRLSLADAVREVVMKRGLRGLWRGTVPRIWNSLPYSIVGVNIYEWAKRSAVNQSSGIL